MRQRSEGATVLLGMPEFVVGAQLAVGGELWLMVETTSEVVGCEGVWHAGGGHARRRLTVRDLPLADRPGGAGVGRAPVALPGCGVRGGHVVRGGRRHRAAGGADRAGPSRDLPSRG
jgi:hypothetical protein